MQGPREVGQVLLVCSIMKTFSIKTQDLLGTFADYGAGMQTNQNPLVTRIEPPQLVKSGPDSMKCPTSSLPLWTVTFFVVPSEA